MKATTAALLVVTGLSMPAQAQQGVLTLACKGTTIVTTMEDAKPEPISMGLVANFTTRRVEGFGVVSTLMDYPVEITGINDATISFGGSQYLLATSAHIGGSMDRVTGDVKATSVVRATNPPRTIMSMDYSLKCRPAQRMF